MRMEPNRSDYRDTMVVIFALAGPDGGQIEWLLDRIEGAWWSGA